jgi:DDE superfamily endonuclease
MTNRKPVEPAPGPLEDYAVRFDDLFANRAQRQGFRRYLEGLLLAEERNKTLTALANTEPLLGAQRKEAQSLQWFLSESSWDPEKVSRLRIGLMLEEPATAADESGALIIDETGDRKDGKKTAHVGHQYLGEIGKIANGVVSVSSVYADERLYYPLEVEPYTPAHHFEGGRADGAFRTKPHIALQLVERAIEMELPFRAVVADILYGEHREFRRGLQDRRIPYVLALKPSYSWYLPTGGARQTVQELAREAGWDGEDSPGEWVALKRSFRDGHAERWWAFEPKKWPFEAGRQRRLVVTTTDPATLPDLTTFYLLTNLASPEGDREAGDRELAAADLAEVARLYALRSWIEQSYKQVKNSLGWAHYQVRSDLAIRRHWQLVCCAFCFCWWAWPGPQEVPIDVGSPPAAVVLEEESSSSTTISDEEGADGGKKEASENEATGAAAGYVATSSEEGTRVAAAIRDAPAILAGVHRSAPAQTARSTAR